MTKKVKVIGETRDGGWLQKLQEKLHPSGTLIVPTQSFKGKVFPTIGFDKLTNIRMADTDCGTAIDMIAGQVVRGGFETTMSEDYTEKSDGLTAKEVVDEKAQEFGLDQILYESVADVVGLGESLIWKGLGSKIKHLVRILPSTIEDFIFDDSGLELKGVETPAKIFYQKELIRFSYNRIGKLPIGFGILNAIATGYHFGNVYREPMCQLKARITQAMADQIDEFSSPTQMWIFPDTSDAKLAKYNSMIQNLKKGERLAFNRAGAQVVSAVAERMRGLDLYVEKIWNSYYMAFQSPIAQLFSGDQLTQASASTALQIAEVGKIDVLRRYIKRVTEQEIFNKWLEDAGLDPKQAKVRLNWRLLQRPDANVLLPVVHEARVNGDLSRSEYRKVMADFGLPIDPEAVKELEEEERKKEEKQQKMFDQRQQLSKEPDNKLDTKQPIQSAQKKYDSRRDDQNHAGE